MLVMNETAPPVADEDAAEEAEAAISTVDSNLAAPLTRCACTCAKWVWSIC